MRWYIQYFQWNLRDARCLCGLRTSCEGSLFHIQQIKCLCYYWVIRCRWHYQRSWTLAHWENIIQLLTWPHCSRLQTSSSIIIIIIVVIPFYHPVTSATEIHNMSFWNVWYARQNDMFFVPSVFFLSTSCFDKYHLTLTQPNNTIAKQSSVIYNSCKFSFNFTPRVEKCRSNTKHLISLPSAWQPLKVPSDTLQNICNRNYYSQLRISEICDIWSWGMSFTPSGSSYKLLNTLSALWVFCTIRLTTPHLVADVILEPILEFKLNPVLLLIDLPTERGIAI